MQLETSLHNILLLDPPGGEELRGLAQAFRRLLGDGCTVHAVATRGELLRTLHSDLPYDLVVVDFAKGDGEESGPRLLRLLRQSHADIPVIAVAPRGDTATVRDAIHAGASEFMVLGDDLETRVSIVLAKVRPLRELRAENQALAEQQRRWLEHEDLRHTILGQSPQIRSLLERIARVAPFPRPVLVLGERGTGKELVARALHAAAGERRRPLVIVNCAAFPDALLESELFGHEKGAFTGADRQVRGKFENADGGTLFLDEIATMSLPFQQKILRTIEYGTFTRVGGTRELRTTARIVAATNADLGQRMRDGEFLRDLYDRLSFEVIEVPPLREREGDIELLAQHFLQGFVREFPELGRRVLAPTALDALRRYDFPGNVRELKNVIERAAYRDTGPLISPADLGLWGPAEATSPPPAHSAVIGAGPAATGSFRERVEAFKRDLVLQALDEAGGNQSAAARHLELAYHQYRYLLRKVRSQARSVRGGTAPRGADRP